MDNEACQGHHNHQKDCPCRRNDALPPALLPEGSTESNRETAVDAEDRRPEHDEEHWRLDGACVWLTNTPHPRRSINSDTALSQSHQPAVENTAGRPGRSAMESDCAGAPLASSMDSSHAGRKSYAVSASPHPGPLPKGEGDLVTRPLRGWQTASLRLRSSTIIFAMPSAAPSSSITRPPSPNAT